MPERVRITDVAARDGLQNEAAPIPTARKIRLVDALSASACDEVEVSSFVSPRWVPQLGDAAEVFAGIAPRAGVAYSALVPNDRGLAAALAVRDATRARFGRALPDKLAVFTAASQTFSQKNTGASIAESIARFGPIASACREHTIPLRAYISCVIACPFEGPIDPGAVVDVAAQLLALAESAGIPVEIDLGDTIGAGTPETIGPLFEMIWRAIPSLGPDHAGGVGLTLHLHDTFGAAAQCVERALDMGVRSFDASAGGLGGCPYASTPTRRAPGNIATQTLIDVLDRRGLACGIDRSALAAASALALEIASDARRAPTEAGGGSS